MNIISEDIKWYVDGILKSEFNGQDTIESSNTNVSQQWHVEFPYTDGYNELILVSNTITIAVDDDSPPPDDSKDISGYSVSYIIFFISISVIGLITNRKKKK